NYYVNDNSITGDIYCSAGGNEANSGLSPGAPKRTLTNVLTLYDLKPDDIVYIDAGTYAEGSTAGGTEITSDDCGDSGGYVTLIGKTNSTFFNGGSTRQKCLYLTGDYIKVKDIDAKRASALMGATGIFITGSHCMVSNCGIYSNVGTMLGRGIFINNNNNTEILNNNIWGNGDLGGININSSHTNTISRNSCYTQPYGINAMNSKYCTYTSNRVRRNIIAGIYINQNCTGSIIASNICFSNYGSYGNLYVVELATACSTNLRIYDNYCYAGMQSACGMRLTGMVGGSVSNNRIYG
ncbi:unnamed protein product, partial [marine sediment metagenome]